MTQQTPAQRLFKLITEPSWREILRGEFDKPYMEAIAIELERVEAAAEHGGPALAPARSDIFRALNEVSVSEVLAVIVGQDPYPNAGDADGLAFSIRSDRPLPDALTKVLAEAKRDLHWTVKTTGDLSSWADSGVLLLNAALTNLVGTTRAHWTLGWQNLIRTVLETIALKARPSAILLWGKDAKTFESVFDGSDHKVQTSDHPSASRSLKDDSGEKPFKGSRPFSEANKFLARERGEVVKWELPPAGPRQGRTRPRPPARTVRATRRRR